MPLVVKLKPEQTLKINGGTVKNIGLRVVRLAVLEGEAERGPKPDAEEVRQTRQWLADMAQYQTRREYRDTQKKG